MASKAVEKPMDILQEKLKCSTPTDAAASSFAAVLNIIFSVQGKKFSRMDSNRRKTLRLTCKAARDVVDARVSYLYMPLDVPLPSRSQPWPWPNILDISLSVVHVERLAQKDVDYLVTLPPLKLKKLRIHFPKDASRAEDNTRRSLEILDSFLQNGSELTHLRIDGIVNKQELATMIASAPLPKLHSLEIVENVSREFFETLFGRDWPVLKQLDVTSTESSVLPLLSSKSWVRNLEILDAAGNGDTTVKELQDFLQLLHLGPIDGLVLPYLHSSTLMAFEGLKLSHLRWLDLQSTRWELGDGAGGVRDASDSINVFFDSCSFPKLTTLILGEQNEGEDADDADVDSLYRGKWRRPPSTGVQQLKKAFPLLNCIILYRMDISRNVADYLACLRRETGCEFDAFGENQSRCEKVPLSPDRQQLLDKLAVDFEKWKEFCKWIADPKMYYACVYWNCLSDVQFKRVAYGALLLGCLDIADLINFLKLVKAEPKDSVMKQGALKSLKDFTKKEILAYKLSGPGEIMTLENISFSEQDGLEFDNFEEWEPGR